MEHEILYKGQTINISGLSDVTKEWIEYHNSLDSDLQAMTSFEPYELKRLVIQPDMEKNSRGINMPGNLLIAGTDLNPRQYMYDANTTKPIFNPNYWNNNPRILMANCYAHAMNVIAQPINGTYYKLQPGEIYHNEIGHEDIQGIPYTAVGAKIAALAIADMTTAPNIFPGITDMRVCQINDVLNRNQYKVALVAAPIQGTADFYDYHWYKECSNGTWSHKPGKTRAVNVDAGGRIIDAQNPPHQCARTYIGANNTLDYSYFVEYFMVTHL